MAAGRGSLGLLLSKGWVTETQGDSPSLPGQQVGAGGLGSEGGGRRRSGRGQRGPVSSVKVKPKVKPGEQATEEGGEMAVRGCVPPGGCSLRPRWAVRTRSRGAGEPAVCSGHQAAWLPGAGVSSLFWLGRPLCAASLRSPLHAVPAGPAPRSAQDGAGVGALSFVLSLTAESKSSRLARRGRSRTVTKWLRK